VQTSLVHLQTTSLKVGVSNIFASYTYVSNAFLLEGDSGIVSLMVKRFRRRSDKKDIPFFGDFVVYDSPELALPSIDSDSVALQNVRLVQVATNRQLRLMLETDTELCRPNSALYLRVSKMCPLFWVDWSDDKEKADLDILSEIPQTGARESVLKKLKPSPTGQGGLKACLARNQDTPRRGLF